MKKEQLILNILFFGAIWGILEATLGYALQFLPPLVSGNVMFPIAAMIMYITYKNTESKKAVFLVALLAASIKAINFMLPGLPPIKTYNPMIAIMLQGLSFMLVIRFVEDKSYAFKFLGIILSSLIWRTAFIINITFNHALTGFKFQQLTSSMEIYRFIFLNGMISALILSLFFGVFMVLSQNKNFKFKLSYTYVVPIIGFAYVITYVLA